MKGNSKVLDILNEVLTAELTAINQYFIHAEMCDDWGFKKLYEAAKKESIEEMKHAERLIERILFLEGQPNMSRYFKINVGKNVKDQHKNDLQLEVEAIERLQKAIRICLEAGDDGSRELLEGIYREEEGHVDWLETQLNMIKEVGLENYLAEQM
ncbi:MAG: bacterioferritin [Calditrichia bacterium]